MSELSLRPQLSARARLKYDRVGGVWLLLCPERGLVLSRTAHATLELCDGERRISDIVHALHVRFVAPERKVQEDVLELLRDLEGNLLVWFRA